MSSTLIKNAEIINDGQSFKASVLIKDEWIAGIFNEPDSLPNADQIIDAEGLWLIPGIIDDQVHFREPGLTHKADIYSESRAAAAGGVTSYMEMPNTKPQTVNHEEMEKKFSTAAEKSLVNYSFYFGATNDNIQEIKKIDPARICGLKVFMGSSTGNMLVDQEESLKAIFAESPVQIVTHCEDESTIRKNMANYQNMYGDNIPVQFHPAIRSAEACYLSSSKAVKLAEKYGARLHILHVSTAEELKLFDHTKDRKQKKITAEVCVHHLWFSENDYAEKGNLIKWNPAVKSEQDRIALLRGLLSGKLDVVATDHAPHTLDEKKNPYAKAPSGGPLVQHSLPAMIELFRKNGIELPVLIDKMCHAPADLFRIDRRGYIRTNYFADLVLIDPKQNWVVDQDNIYYKCRWSPFEGTTFSSRVVKTFVNGKVVYDNDRFASESPARELRFLR